MRRIEKFPRIIDSITKFNFSQGGRPLKNVINVNEIITFGEFSKNSFTSSIGFQNIFIEQGICKKYDLFIIFIYWNSWHVHLQDKNFLIEM